MRAVVLDAVSGPAERAFAVDGAQVAAGYADGDNGVPPLGRIGRLVLNVVDILLCAAEADFELRAERADHPSGEGCGVS